MMRFFCVVAPATAQVVGYNGPYVAGTTADLSCSITDGNPPAMVLWYRQDLSFPAEDDGTVRLTFAKNDNGGTLFCQAENSVGSVTSQTIEMEVYCKHPVVVNLSMAFILGFRMMHPSWFISRLKGISFQEYSIFFRRSSRKCGGHWE